MKEVKKKVRELHPNPYIFATMLKMPYIEQGKRNYFV